MKTNTFQIITKLALLIVAASPSHGAEQGLSPLIPLSTPWKTNILPLKKGDTKSIDAKIMADLEKARQAAGLAANGSRSGKANGDYKTFLFSATAKSGTLTPAKQVDVFTQAVAIWRKVEKADEWSNPPVSSKVFAEYRGMRAITERQAITAYKKGDTASALKKYTSLAQAFSGSPEGAGIDLRILQIQQRQFAKTGNYRDYEKSLIASGDKYHDDQVLGSPNTARAKQTAISIATMHRQLVDRLIATGMNKKTAAPARKSTIAVIDNYLLTNIAEGEKERVRNAKGELQFILPDHIGAAASFSSLATETKGGKSKDYWRKAIRSQLILSSWTPTAPWDGFSAGKDQARETLKGMYGQITSDGDWASISQIGLLNLSLNQEAEAFKLWTSTISKSSKSSDAQHAAGYMISTYTKGKRWQEAEDLSRIMIKLNLVGIHRKETYKGRDILGNALIDGGLQKYAAQDFKTAVTKLNEFVQGWKDHKRHNEGFYFLAMAHNGAGNYRIAVETMVNFTKSYPTGKYRRESLVNGGNWALAMAWEEHVMYFLELHVREFSKDPQVLASLDSLANLYMGREHVDAATRIMQIQLAHPAIDAITKADIARRLLDLYERQGNRENSLSIAKMMLKNFKDHSDIAASALSLTARMSANSGKNDLASDCFPQSK